MSLDQQTLRATLVDSDKIMKFLTDRAQRSFEEIVQRLKSRQYVDMRVVTPIITEHSLMTWEVMRDAYSQGPEFEYQNPKQKRHLREALRLLNFGAHAVSTLLSYTRDTGTGELVDSPTARLEVARTALSIAENLALKCTPGPKTYNHPQYAKWQRLIGQCHRRLAALNLEEAKRREQMAVLGPLHTGAKT